MLTNLKARIASILWGMMEARTMLEKQETRLESLDIRLSAMSTEFEIVKMQVQAKDEEIRHVTTLVESWAMRMAKLEQESAVISMAAYQDLVAQRDALLNERDRLLVQLHDAQRSRGLALDSARVHAQRPRFPEAALPNRAIPKVHIVDVGAQNLASEEHIYQPLVNAGAAFITGFEPLKDAAEKRSAEDPSLTMLNHFIGDGETRKFYINRFDPTSSLLPADLTFLGRFESLAEMCSPVQVIDVATTRLDDLPQVADCDFLKIDVQGGELDVLRFGGNVLANTVVVHCEVEFSRLYQDQPLFGDIDAHLRGAGFELADIINAGYSSLKGLPRPISRSRLLWAEAIYFRCPETIATLDAQKIVKAAFIAHVNYGMYDVAASLLAVLDRQGGTQYAKSYGDAMCWAI